MVQQLTRPIPQINGRVGTPQVHMQSAMNVARAMPQMMKQKQQGGSILAQAGPVTQQYGQQSQYDVFSQNRSPAFEVAVPVGTALSTPPGQWKVVDSYSDANPNGYVGDFQGQGWGNHVRLQNVQTGEVIGYNHLSQVDVKNGDVLQGNTQVGLSGKSGNATGPHVAFTYQNAQGQSGDFAKSPYAQFLPQQVLQGLGNIASSVGQSMGGVLGGAMSAAGNLAGAAGQVLGGMQSQQQQPQSFIFDMPQTQTADQSQQQPQATPQTPQYTPFVDPNAAATQPQQQTQGQKTPPGYQGIYSPNQSFGQGGGVDQNMLDRIDTAPTKALEAFYPQGRQLLQSMPPVKVPLAFLGGQAPALPLGQLAAGMLYDSDATRQARAQAQAGQPLTPQQQQQAIGQMIGRVIGSSTPVQGTGSITGADAITQDINTYRNALQSGDMSTLDALSDKYPGDPRFNVHSLFAPIDAQTQGDIQKAFVQDANPVSMGSVNPAVPMTQEQIDQALQQRNALIQQSGFTVGQPVTLPDGSTSKISGFGSSFADPSGISVEFENGKNMNFQDAQQTLGGSTTIPDEFRPMAEEMKKFNSWNDIKTAVDQAGHTPEMGFGSIMLNGKEIPIEQQMALTDWAKTQGFKSSDQILQALKGMK